MISRQVISSDRLEIVELSAAWQLATSSVELSGDLPVADKFLHPQDRNEFLVAAGVHEAKSSTAMEKQAKRA